MNQINEPIGAYWKPRKTKIAKMNNGLNIMLVNPTQIDETRSAKKHHESEYDSEND